MRYIDADKLIAHLKDEIKACEPKFGSRANGKSIAYGTKLGLQSAISFAETLAADVVPKSEVEALQEAISKAEADVKNYMKVAEYQQSLSIKRYHEIKRLKEDIERLEDINERDVENIRLAKAEVAREIFEEIEKHLFVITPIEEFDGWARMMLCDFERLKKKYTEGKT